MRYLESLDSSVKVGGVLLVASFADPIGYAEPDGFLKYPVDFEKVKQSISGKVIMIHSDNDRYISNQIAQSLSRNLNCELITIHNAGHFTAKDGYTQFPKAKEELERLLKTVS